MSEAVEPSRMTPRGRAPGGLRHWLAPLLFVASLVVLLVLAIPFFRGGPADEGLDADLCTEGAVAGRAVLLLDLRKPVAPLPGLPRSVLRRVSRSLGADTELRVFALADDPMAPRALLGRVCKPYANDELAARADKGGADLRDCDDLPTQLPTRLRERAQMYCDRRAAIERKIAALVAQPPPMPVADAYLVEAIDDTRLELAETSGAATLHVLSDMMQHAPWYSHLEREPDDWDADAFSEARRSQAGLLDEPPPAPTLAVHVYYVPRRGTTERPSVARAHKQFWRAYFADAGVVAFDDLPVLPGYEKQSLTRSPEPPVEGPPAEASQAPDDVQAERKDAERLLEVVQAERAAAELEREEAAAAAQRLDTRAADLDRREEALAREEARAREELDRASLAAADGEEADDALDSDAADTADAKVDVVDEPPAFANAPATEPPRTAAARVEACPVVLRPGMRRAAVYPNDGWRNFGSADIAVRYMIDDDGETIDDRVSMATDESRSDVSRFMPRFAAAAEDLVRGWAFDFTSTEACVKRQQHVAVVRFRYRR